MHKDDRLFSSSYYKKILAKQHEMNDAEGDTTEYIHDPRCDLHMTSKMKSKIFTPGKRHI